MPVIIQKCNYFLNCCIQKLRNTQYFTIFIFIVINELINLQLQEQISVHSVFLFLDGELVVFIEINISILNKSILWKGNSGTSLQNTHIKSRKEPQKDIQLCKGNYY